MSATLGDLNLGSMYAGSRKIAEAWLGNVKVYGGAAPGPTLPAYTIRMKFDAGVTPSPLVGTVTQVSAEPNIWDYTYQNQDWSNLFRGDSYYTGLNGLRITEVIDANLNGVLTLWNAFNQAQHLTSVTKISAPDCTTFTNMFNNCTQLVSVREIVSTAAVYMGSMFSGCPLLLEGPKLSTSNVVDMNSMFSGCTSLRGTELYDTHMVQYMNLMFYNDARLQLVLLFDTSSCTNMGSMYYGCNQVEEGALALYQQASTQTTPPPIHAYAFYNCGQNTQTGAAELAQIPASWGGRAP